MSGVSHESDDRGDASAGIDHESTGTPRWVKVLGVIGLIVALLVIIMLLTGIGGEHGPSRHTSPDGTHTSPAGTHTS